MTKNKIKIYVLPIAVCFIGGMLISFVAHKLTGSAWAGLPFCFIFGCLVGWATDTKLNK